MSKIKKSSSIKPNSYVAFSGGKRNNKTTKATVQPLSNLPKTRGPASRQMLSEDLGKR